MRGDRVGPQTSPSLLVRCDVPRVAFSTDLRVLWAQHVPLVVYPKK